MKMIKWVLIAAVAMVHVGCGSDGADGTGCSVVSMDGMSRVVCDDGTSAEIPSDSTSCSVQQENGTVAIVCEDGTRAELPPGSSCRVEQNDDGSATIRCSDGTSADIGRQMPAPDTAPVLELVAGVTSVGSNDGVGTQSRMDGALHAAFSPDGNFLYFVDSFNGTIRRFGLLSGRVVTIAGEAGAEGITDGVGSAARFENPRGIAIDPSGSTLYVADGFNCTMRTVDTASFEVRTLFGVPRDCGYADGNYADSRMGLVIGMAMRDNRYVYFAQRANGANAIRRIDLESARVETIAGGSRRGHNDGPGSEALFSGPGGIDFDESGEWLWVNDTFNSVIRRISLTAVDGSGNFTFPVETVAGSPGESGRDDGVGTSARFAVSQGLARGRDGFYVAGFHDTVRRISGEAPYEVETVAGRAGERGSRDGHPLEARFGVAFGIHAHPDGERLYYMDRGNNNIREIQLAFDRVRTVMGAPQPDGWRDGEDARFSKPTGVVATADASTLFVADRYNHVVRRVDAATGETETLAGLPGVRGYRDAVSDGALLNQPVALALSANEEVLWISESGNNAIRALNLQTLELTTVTGGPERSVGEDAPEASELEGAAADVPWGSITGLAFDAANNLLYASDYTLDRIRTIDLGAGTVSNFAGGTARPMVPRLDDDGNPVVDEEGNPVMMPSTDYEPDGVGEAAIFIGPFGLALSSDGTRLFVADRFQHVIRAVEVATRTVSTIAGERASEGAFDDVGVNAGFRGPTSVSLSRDGLRLYVVDAGNHAVRRIELSSATVDTVVGQLEVSGGTGFDRTPLDAARLYYPEFVFVSGDDVFLTGENMIYRAYGVASAP